MAEEIKCPIWGTPATSKHILDRDCDRVDSVRAGVTYIISREAKDDYFANSDCVDDHTKARLTTWLIDQHRLGIKCPEVTTYVIGDARLRRSLAMHERADRLLEYFRKKTPLLGEAVMFFPNYIPPDNTTLEILAWSESVKADEAMFLINYLKNLGWIDNSGATKDGPSLIVTGDGYKRLADLSEKEIISKQAFIAMWFDQSMNDAYEKGIAAGVRDAGYQPLRIDQKHHNNKIDDEIIAEIRRSRFLVADFTQGPDGSRGGVYYEAGFAHGFNIPVIFTCRKETIEKVHFDTRQYSHILWENPEDLRKQLADRISATIGDGPLRKGP